MSVGNICQVISDTSHHQVNNRSRRLNMYCKNIAIALAVATGVIAQRPADTPICDYYTTALLKNNTGANQYTLLTLLVNTVVIGNCKSHRHCILRPLPLTRV